MASLTENKPLLYSLLATTTVLFVLAAGLVPELSVFLEITSFTDEVTHTHTHSLSHTHTHSYDIVYCTVSTQVANRISG